MEIKERTRVYEMLVRYGADGTMGGQLSSITEYLVDGVVVSAKVTAPVTLSDAFLASLPVSNPALDVATVASPWYKRMVGL